MRDLYDRLSAVVALAPGAKVIATTNGTAVDLLSVNNGNNSCMFSVVAGQITDGTHTFSLQDSPDNSTWTNVAAPYIQGAGQSFTSATASGAVVKLGYLGNANGNSRYVRLVSTVTSATTGGYYSAIAVLGEGNSLPAA